MALAFFPRFCVPRPVLDLLGDPFLVEREPDFAANVAFIPFRDRPEIFRGRLLLAPSLASKSFVSSRTRRGETPRIFAVSSVVTNGASIRTPIRTTIHPDSRSRPLALFHASPSLLVLILVRQLRKKAYRIPFAQLAADPKQRLLFPAIERAHDGLHQLRVDREHVPQEPLPLRR